MHPETFHRYSAQRAACKLWGVALGVVIVLVGALGKLEAANLLAAALPLVLLGWVDAAYAGQERRCVELLNNKKGADEFAGLLPEGAGASVARTTHAALSLAIWPFCLGLFAIAAASNGVSTSIKEEAAHRVLHTAGPMAPAAVAKAGCGSGGCGKAGGCGSGGCGASAGQSCSCSGGATKTAAAPKPVQQYLQTATGPIPVQAQPPRPASAPAFPVRPPVNPVIQRNTVPVFPAPVQAAPPGIPVVPQPPASTAPVPAPGAPNPPGGNLTPGPL